MCEVGYNIGLPLSAIFTGDHRDYSTFMGGLGDGITKVIWNCLLGALA